MRTFTGKMPQTLFEPVQSKRMPRFHKSHFMRTFTGKMPQTLFEPVQSKRMPRFHKSHFSTEIYR